MRYDCYAAYVRSGKALEVGLEHGCSRHIPVIFCTGWLVSGNLKADIFVTKRDICDKRTVVVLPTDKGIKEMKFSSRKNCLIPLPYELAQIHFLYPKSF